MPTPDRTTIKAAIAELRDLLETNLTADPPTAAKPFRRVAVHAGGTDEFPRPFLTLHLSRTRVLGTCDGDKLIEVTMGLRVVTDVIGGDLHAAVLDKIGAVEDYLDGLIDTGVLDGAEGFDDRGWAFDYPRTTAGARLAAASATGTFVVKVEREQNREVQVAVTRQMLALVSQTGTGSGNIDATFGLDRRFRLVFVRCHFAGAAGTNPLVLSLDAGAGADYDARLFAITQAGVGRDVNLRITGADLLDPSPWTFEAADRVRVQWTNPDSGNITWGLTVGLALAA